jgi:ATP-dependent Clp protease ATP-binding subunit ClpA
MFERFTDRARRVVVLAQEEARGLNHGYIGTEHLLLGLISEGSGIGARALEGLGVELERSRRSIKEMIGKGGSEVPAGHIPFTPRAKKVLELSLREALTLGHNYIGTEHILLGLVREQEGVGAQVLGREGLSIDDVRTKVIELLSGLTAASPGPPHQRIVDAAIERFDRFSPGLRAAIEAAAGYAASASSIGSQHLLAVFADWDDLAANAALRAGGFDVTKLASPIVDWPVAGTRDETREEWGERVTEVTAEGGTVTIRITDQRVAERLSSSPTIARSIGVALHFLASPDEGSVSEAGDAAQAPGAGGQEDDDEQHGADEDDGGS